MSNREFFIERWDAEFPATLRVLKALPMDKLDYRPHPRSMSAGDLAALLAEEAGSLIELCDKGSITWGGPPKIKKLGEMVSEFERASKTVSEKLRKLSDAAWEKKAPFYVDGKDAIGETAGGLCWLWLFDSIHHRGQLSVYLRLVDVPLPSIYGPTADEPW